MKNKKYLLITLTAFLAAGCLAGQNARAMTLARDNRIVQTTDFTAAVAAEEDDVNEICQAVEENSISGAVEISESSEDAPAAEAASDAEQTEDRVYQGYDKAVWQERCKMYEPFGLTYDAQKNELWYKQKLVRWFEDYYPIDSQGQAGIDFFNEKGVVDIYALRDLKNITPHLDGSYDPSGKLIGLKEFSPEEFAARDIEAITCPSTGEAIAGDPPSLQEMKEIAAEYKPFGVTYDAVSGQWYYQGKKVRYFLDILTSNGKELEGGEFEGDI